MGKDKVFSGNFVQRQTKLLVLCLCVLLSIFSCKNAFTPVEPQVSDLPPGMGSLLVSFSTDERTILPRAPLLNDIAVFELNFISGDNSVPITFDLFNSELPPKLTLPAGTYELEVNAYMDFGKTMLVAQGIRDRVVVFSGLVVRTNVVLRVRVLLDEGDTGIFSWNITIATTDIDVNEAEMNIISIDGTNSWFSNLLAEPTGERVLPSGVYNVEFTLIADENIVQWHEILHVYSWLTSYCTLTFTDAHFSRTHYNVEFHFNYNDIRTESFWHGEIAVNPSTFTSADLYLYRGSSPAEPYGWNIDGWYTNPQFSGNPWDFDNPIQADTILYAKWSGLVELTDPNSFSDAIDYVNSNPGDYTLLLGADVNIGAQALNDTNVRLTIEGLNQPRIINISPNFRFTVGDRGISNVGLTIGNNINIDGEIFVWLPSSFTLFGDNHIDMITLSAIGTTVVANASITINSDWDGNIEHLNLYGDSVDLDVDTNLSVIGYWLGKTVLQVEELTPRIEDLFDNKLGDFIDYNGFSRPITAPHLPSAPNGYMIEYSDGVGRLVVKPY